jgi:hypothetical protein
MLQRCVYAMSHSTNILLAATCTMSALWKYTIATGTHRTVCMHKKPTVSACTVFESSLLPGNFLWVQTHAANTASSHDLAHSALPSNALHITDLNCALCETS